MGAFFLALIPTSEDSISYFLCIFLGLCVEKIASFIHSFIRQSFIHIHPFTHSIHKQLLSAICLLGTEHKEQRAGARTTNIPALTDQDQQT